MWTWIWSQLCCLVDNLASAILSGPQFALMQMCIMTVALGIRIDMLAFSIQCLEHGKLSVGYYILLHGISSLL